jgi:hypothetical protein
MRDKREDICWAINKCSNEVDVDRVSTSAECNDFRHGFPKASFGSCDQGNLKLDT